MSSEGGFFLQNPKTPDVRVMHLMNSEGDSMISFPPLDFSEKGRVDMSRQSGKEEQKSVFNVR